MHDPELLQAIRQEIVLCAGMPQLSANLFFIDSAVLRSHIERLYLGGELIAEARIEHGRLALDINGLTVFGLWALRRHDTAA